MSGRESKEAVRIHLGTWKGEPIHTDDPNVEAAFKFCASEMDRLHKQHDGDMRTLIGLER